MFSYSGMKLIIYLIFPLEIHYLSFPSDLRKSVTNVTSTTIKSDDPENEGFLEVTTKLRGWRTTEQTDNQILPTTRAPPSFLITFNDSFGAKPGPNSVTTFPDPPRTSTTPAPPEGSGDVDGALFSSGDIEDEIIKIDEGTLGSKVPDGLSSADDQIANTTNETETTTAEDVGSGAIDSTKTVTLVSNTQDDAMSSSSSENETVETTEVEKSTWEHITEEVRISNDLI